MRSNITKIHPLVAEKFVELLGVPDSFKKQVIKWVEDYYERTRGVRQDHSMTSWEIYTELYRIEKLLSRLVERTSTEKSYYDFLTSDNYLKTSKIHDRYDPCENKSPMWTEKDVQEIKKRLPGVELVRRNGSETEIHPELGVIYVRNLQAPEHIQKQAINHAKRTFFIFIDKKKWHMTATLASFWSKQRAGYEVPSYYTDSSGEVHCFPTNIDIQAVKSPNDAVHLATVLKRLDQTDNSYFFDFIQWLEEWAAKGATFQAEHI
jgi:hypothetical protein